LKGFMKSIAMYVVIFVVIVLLVQGMMEPAADIPNITFSQLIVQIKSNNIKSLSFTDSDVKGV